MSKCRFYENLMKYTPSASHISDDVFAHIGGVKDAWRRFGLVLSFQEQLQYCPACKISHRRYAENKLITLCPLKDESYGRSSNDTTHGSTESNGSSHSSNLFFREIVWHNSIYVCRPSLVREACKRDYDNCCCQSVAIRNCHNRKYCGSADKQTQRACPLYFHAALYHKRWQPTAEDAAHTRKELRNHQRNDSGCKIEFKCFFEKIWCPKQEEPPRPIGNKTA